MRLPRLAEPALTAGALLVAVAVLYVRDPHVSGSYGFCPWLLLTGSYCPGCGGLRAVNDLAHGDLAAAASSNLLVVALLPVAGLAFAGWARARWRGRPFRPPLGTRPALRNAVLWSTLAVLAVFTLLRNLGPTAWLAP